MLIDTLKIIVSNSKTLEELEECDKLLKDKKRGLRKLHFEMLEDSVAKPFIDALEGQDYSTIMAHLLSMPEDFKLQFAKELSDSEKVEEMLEEVQDLEDKVSKKMKGIIWRQ